MACSLNYLYINKFPINNLPWMQVLVLVIYQIKVDIKPYNTKKFVKFMCSFSQSVNKNKGCLGYSVYQDSEKENTYSMVGEWKSHNALEKHLQTRDFQLLIGAAKKFGESYRMSICNVLKTGSLDLARELIAGQQKRETAL